MIPFNKLGWAFHSFGSFFYPSRVKELLCETLQPLDPKAKLLDIGAGTGMLCRFAAVCNPDLQLHAIDPAQGMLKYCPEQITTHLGKAECLPFEASTFDAVVIGEALHHFEDIDTSLREITRVLKRGGKLFIYDFDPSTLMGVLIAKGEKLLGEPGNFFMPERLQGILEDHGFEVSVDIFGFRYIAIGKLRIRNREC